MKLVHFRIELRSVPLFTPVFHYSTIPLFQDMHANKKVAFYWLGMTPLSKHIFLIVDIGDTAGKSGRLITDIFHTMGLHAGYVDRGPRAANDLFL